MSSFSIGTRVKVVNEKHRNGEIGYVGRVKPNQMKGNSRADVYYVKFEDGKVSSFFESNLRVAPCTAHLMKTIDGYRSIAAISNVFIEAGVTAEETINGPIGPFEIKEVTHGDVTSKHFVDWFFMLENWTDATPDTFPYSEITHGDDFCVYGYFKCNDLDGIIRVDDNGDNYKILFFCVNEACQHQGIGQYLLQFVLEKFRNKKITLDVYMDNIPAVHIYRKYGFKTVGVGFGKGISPESSHYIMQRDVQPASI